MASALVLAALAFLIGLVGFARQIATVERVPTRHADGIVALTGGADRVSDAVALLAGGHAAHLLITGVNQATTRDDLLRHVPGARDWLGCCIDLGYQAENTTGNAQETAAWARSRDLRSLIVVTSNYHMPRALAEMSDELPDLDLQAYPVVTEPWRIGPWRLQTWPTAIRLARLIVAEYVKYLAVKTRQIVLRSTIAADVHLARGDR